jgi:hypothetical protein
METVSKRGAVRCEFLSRAARQRREFPLPAIAEEDSSPQRAQRKQGKFLIRNLRLEAEKRVVLRIMG